MWAVAAEAFPMICQREMIHTFVFGRARGINGAGRARRSTRPRLRSAARIASSANLLDYRVMARKWDCFDSKELDVQTFSRQLERKISKNMGADEDKIRLATLLKMVQVSILIDYKAPMSKKENREELSQRVPLAGDTIFRQKPNW